MFVCIYTILYVYQRGLCLPLYGIIYKMWKKKMNRSFGKVRKIVECIIK